MERVAAQAGPDAAANATTTAAPVATTNNATTTDEEFYYEDTTDTTGVVPDFRTGTGEAFTLTDIEASGVL